MFNKLGHYIFKRMCKDQKELRLKRPMNTYGLYIQPKDLQRYIDDYMSYGIDYTGDDNMAPEDRLVSNHERIDKYWDEPDGVEY